MVGGRELLQLSFYQPSHEAILATFQLPKEQIQYTQLPSEAIELCNHDKNRHGIVILFENKPIGFFGLRHGESALPYVDYPNALLLHSFLIDFKQQGKGFAKKALKLLPDFVKKHFPMMNEIVLAVNEKNTVAKHLYLATNFQDRGRRRMGPIGQQLILQYFL